MKTLPDKCVDLVLTDPPYGIGMDKGFGGFEGFGGFGCFGEPIARRQYADCWDSTRPTKEVFDEILRIAKNVLIFGGNFFADILPQSTHWLSWDKLNTMPSFGDCELVWTNSKRKSVKKYVFEYNGLLGKEQKRHHPTQKPVGLLKLIVSDYSQSNNLILDPFCGSGTTCVAAELLGRRWIGVEISEEYCKIARKRVKEAQEQFSLLESNK